MFLNDLIVERLISKRNRWRLVQPLVYVKMERHIKVFVPKGFIFDFASIPNIFWTIFAPNGGRYDRASCVHDWLYSIQLHSRKFCDEVFYYAMLDDKTPQWKAKLFYYSVRAFGWIAWKRKDKKLIEFLRKYANAEEIPDYEDMLK